VKQLVLLAIGAIGSSIGAQQPNAPHLTSAISRSDLDLSVSACTDFFRFANGGWFPKNPIPPTRTAWGIGLQMYQANQAVLDSIVKEAARAPASKGEHDTRTLGIYYASFMDSAAAERAGWQPIALELKRIESMRTRLDIESEIARLQKQYVLVPFLFYSARDFENSKRIVAALYQARLPLPERGYYLRTDSASIGIQVRYSQHIVNLMRLVGRDSVRALDDARRALALETALAEVLFSPAERRTTSLIHHKMNRADLARLMPGFDWARFLSAMDRPDIDLIDVENPRFASSVDSLLGALPPEDWRAFLRWALVNFAAPNLSTPFVNEDFRFTSALFGATENQPRSERAVERMMSDVPDILDRKYLKARFSERSLVLAREMVRNMADAFQSRLQRLSWMGDSTKQQALEKLAAVNYQIGFPTKWRDFSTLEVRPGPFYPNMVASLRLYHEFNLSHIGKGVDRDRWSVSVSAGDFYNTGNRIIIPAGNIQPPLFDVTGDDAINYGGLGAIVGHELTHSFDDQGAAFDAHNNLRNWWTPADLARFRQQGALMAAQFDAYTVLDSVHLNGKLTLGENIADYGGLNIAYDAFQNAMRAKGRPGSIDGFTPEQRFFLAYARLWRVQVTPGQERVWVNTNEHAPARWRTNGPLANMPQFAAAFGCKPGDAMVRADSLRPVIW
jgi:putative endopeptidase